MKRSFANFGLAFKKSRLDAGLTQYQAAKLAGIHPQMISNIERGLCRPPVNTFRKLSKTINFGKKNYEAAILADHSLDAYNELTEFFGK